MKQLTTLCIGLLLCIVSSFAQSYDTTQFYGKNNFLFQHIDKTPITTGLLRDYGIDFQELDNYTGAALHDSNFTSLADWRMLYGSIYSQQITSTAALLALDSLNKRFSDYGIVGQPISFVTLYYNYQSINPNAQANNQFYMSNNQLYDVSGRSGNPYVSNEVFAVATTRQAATVGDVPFNFRSLLYLSNTGKTISTVQVDVLGTGNYQTVTIDSNFIAHYDTAGLYTINIKLTYTDNTIKYGHTKLAVYGAGYGTAFINTDFHKTFGYKGYGPPYRHDAFVYGVRSTTNETVQATKAYLGALAEGDITIDLSVNNTTGQIRKPLIVIQGFDPDAKSAVTGYTYLKDLIPNIKIDGNTGNPINLNSGLDDTNEYDMIYLHWHNGTDYIQRNAYLLERVIQIVNNRKTFLNGVRQQNVIIGMSMGGLVARYALKDMENNSIDHETRLFISHDAPHNGANIPVAYQALVQYIAPWKIVDIGFSGNIVPIRWVDMFPQAVNAVDLFNSPAAKQMLIQRYLLQSSGGSTFNSLSYSLAADNSVHNAFMSELNNLGWPANCKNITFANGACNGTTQFADNSKMLSIDGNQSWTYFGGLWRSLVASLGGITAVNIPLTLGSVPIDNNALSAQFPLALISTKTNLVFDFGAWAVPTTGTSEIFRGDIYIKRKLAWLFNSTSYILKCHVSSSSSMLALDNAPGGVYDLVAFGLDINDVNKQLHKSLGDWINANVLKPRFCFVPTVSSLAFDNPTSYYRSSICNIVNCHIPNAVSNFYAPQENQLHISYTQANADWILQNQDPSFTCAKICADNLSITGLNPVCSSETYTLNGALANATISWVLSPSNLASYTATGNQITIQRTGLSSGDLTLSATIVNSCSGGSITIQKQNIQVGVPSQYGAIQNLNNPTKTSYCLNSQDVIFTFNPTSSNSSVTNYFWGYYNSSTGNSNQPILSAHSWDFATSLSSSLSAGTYTVFARPENICGLGNINTTNITLSNDGCGGFGEFKKSNVLKSNIANKEITKIAIFPNPVSNSFTITLPLDSINLPSTIITITDISGRQVEQINTVSETNTIPVSTWANGTYVVTITDGKQKIVKKIVKN